MKTHFAAGGFTICGIDKRSDGHIVTTTHKLAVSCPACMDTPQFRVARQVLPKVQGGPYGAK